MEKRKLWKQMTVLSICTVVASAIPVYAQSRVPEQEAAEEIKDTSDFVIKDGVLLAYCGREAVVVVPEGVTTIGEYAFTSVNRRATIERVVLPSSLKEIKEGAFYGCHDLEEIIIPDGVTCIEKNAFDEELKKIVLPKSIISLKEETFYQNMCPGAGRVSDKYPILYAAPDSYVQEFAADYGYTFRDIALVDEPLPTRDQLSYPTKRIKSGNNCDKPPVQTKDQEDETPKPNKETKPAKQKLTLVKSKKAKQLTISWKKDEKVSGYEIQYSVDKKFKKSLKTCRIKKNTQTTVCLKKLTAGKKYYVRVRSYEKVKVDGKTTILCGKWSTVKSQNIKK